MIVIARRIGRLLHRWYRRRRGRRELARLDPRVLRDARMPVLDAEREAGKPFWRE